METENDGAKTSACVVASVKKTVGVITCLAVHRAVMYAASANRIDVFDLTTFAHVDSFGCPSGASSGSVKSIAFHGDRTVFTAHQDCKIRAWRRRRHDGSETHRFVAVLPTVKDRLLRSVLPRNYVRVRRHEKRLWIEHGDAFSGLAISGGMVYSASWDKSFKIWRASDRRCLESVKAHEDAVNAIAISAVDRTVYTASADGRIRIWEATPGGQPRHKLRKTLAAHKTAVNALALTGDGSVLFSGGSDGSILVWERGDGRRHVAMSDALAGHDGPVLCLAVSAGGVLVSGSYDRTVRVWTRGDGGKGCRRYGCAAVLEGHGRAVKSLAAYSPASEELSLSAADADEDRDGDGNDCDSHVLMVCSGSLDGEIKVWEVRL